MLANILEIPKHLGDEDNVRKMLKAQLDRVPSAWRDKIGVLLNLGREAHEKYSLCTSLPAGQGVIPLDALSLCDRRTRAEQYLERGLAVMCSESLDLESSDAPGHGNVQKGSVFERAWSRFGRELAGSEPDEWSWFAQRARGTGALERIYLRRGSHAWWSFGASLDRPQKSHIAAQQAEVGKRRQGGSGTGLESLVAHHYAERPALLRAMRSVNARMGIVAGCRPASAVAR